MATATLTKTPRTASGDPRVLAAKKEINDLGSQLEPLTSSVAAARAALAPEKLRARAGKVGWPAALEEKRQLAIKASDSEATLAEVKLARLAALAHADQVLAEVRSEVATARLPELRAALDAEREALLSAFEAMQATEALRSEIQRDTAEGFIEQPYYRGIFRRPDLYALLAETIKLTRQRRLDKVL